MSQIQFYFDSSLYLLPSLNESSSCFHCLFWRPHCLTSGLRLSWRSLAVGHDKQQRNTTAACTHKGESRSHTCRAARCTNTEAASWEPRVRNTELGWDDTTALCFYSSFTLTILDLMSGCGRALIAPPRPTETLNNSFSTGWDSPGQSEWKLHCNAS